jgi:uncharacterized protein (TIGR03086 family)
MADNRAPAASIGGIALLERAINYTLGSLHLVTPVAMSRPTPCRGWDLRTLLAHLDDSLLALHQAVAVGRVDLDGLPDAHPDDPVAILRGRAAELLGAWTADDARRTITVGGSPLTTGIVTGTGAIEITVHGWDVARACGRSRPIPPHLADELLDLAVLVVSGSDRPGRFAGPVRVPPPACPGDRLVAFLGRDPRLS